MPTENVEPDLVSEINELAGRFSEGDDVAFEQLLRLLSPALFAFLRSQAQARIDVDALVQEVWTSVWRNRGRFEIRNFRGWLFTVARNRLRDAARKKTTSALPENFDPQQEQPLDDDYERLQALRECLNEIEPKFAAITREHLSGTPAEEIARRHGIKTGTVYSRASRGRDQLRACIEGKLC